MSGQAQEALKVYERMLTAGAQPTATTYTALISAYGKNGQLDRALQIFEDMVSSLAPNVRLVNAMVYARQQQMFACVSVSKVIFAHPRLSGW